MAPIDGHRNAWLCSRPILRECVKYVRMRELDIPQGERGSLLSFEEYRENAISIFFYVAERVN